MSLTVGSRRNSSTGPRPKISSITSRSSCCFSAADSGRALLVEQHVDAARALGVELLDGHLPRLQQVHLLEQARWTLALSCCSGRDVGRRRVRKNRKLPLSLLGCIGVTTSGLLRRRGDRLGRRRLLLRLQGAGPAAVAAFDVLQCATSPVGGELPDLAPQVGPRGRLGERLAEVERLGGGGVVVAEA